MVGQEGCPEILLNLDKAFAGAGMELGELDVSGPDLDKGVEASGFVLVLDVLNAGVKLRLEVIDSSCRGLQVDVIKVEDKNISLHGVKSVHNLLHPLSPGFNQNHGHLNLMELLE